MLTQIRSETANKMRGKLDALAQVTQSELGREWLLKALHPTDPTIGGVGIPDGTASDTVCLELTTSVTVGAGTLSAPPVGPWGAKVVLTPHMLPGSIYPTEGAAGAAIMDIRYPLFTGASPNADYSKLWGLAEAWRLCAQSVTIHLDANSTKDSGTVVAAQQVTKPAVIFQGMSATGKVNCPIIYFQKASDNPGYTQLMSLPRAYQANLREGLYMPLKLSSTCQHWNSFRESCMLADESAFIIDAAGWQLQPAGVVPWPFGGITPPVRSAVNNDVTGAVMAAFMGDNWGHIALSGIDPASAVVFKFRTILEMKVQASSVYAPHMKPAAHPDHLAIDNYFAILRGMPDAYPADYNDAGKIMSVIGRAIRVVSPYLKFVPGVGPALDKMADPVSKILVEVGKNTSDARKAFKQKNPNAGKKAQRKAVAKSVTKKAAEKAVRALVAAT